MSSSTETSNTKSFKEGVLKPLKIITSILWFSLLIGRILPQILMESYNIRIYAITNFGPIIHEFDPYFNFRATEYLYYNGWQRFVTWFDYQSWYPLGRPVGTTIYPGMQVTAVFIKRYIVGDRMSLNDVCVYVPAWFGVLATLFTGLLAYECSLPVNDGEQMVINKKSKGKEEPKNEPFTCILSSIPIIGYLYDQVITVLLTYVLDTVEKFLGTDFGLRLSKYNSDPVSSPALEVGLCTMAVMAIVPAHLMRSIGGGFDNESIAITAMSLTFWLWTRSLRCKSDALVWPCVWGTLTGVAYFNMVAAWGGYIFVLNLIGCHAAFLVLIGRYTSKLHRAYSTFYVIGTALAIQVPVVGLTPLKSLEQLAPCAVFFGMQLLEIVEYKRRKNNLSNVDVLKLRVQLFASMGLLVILAGVTLTPTGYFGPISARVRGLFVKHTKTGNPLVDSVAEHQPATHQAYEQYLDKALPLIPYGFVLVAMRYFSDSSSFLLVYGMATYFFSLKMVRLVLLTAPIASVLCGVLFGHVVSFAFYNIFGFSPSLRGMYNDLFASEETETTSGKSNSSSKKTENLNGKGKQKKNKKKAEASSVEDKKKSSTGPLQMGLSLLWKLCVIGAVYHVHPQIQKAGKDFYEKCNMIATQMSHPTILQRGTLKSGEVVTVDDYRDCYWWIRDNTPKDSRVLAWWDYGYQITAIANRTTIADGNTWNHEHIALLGRVLTSPEKEGHRIARHLADYVLVWAGGGGDDLAKSPHLARIANSVYRSMCPGDPTCSKFGYDQNGPSKMMRESFLFKLHSHRMGPGITADPNRFTEAYTSKYGKCRVYKMLSVSKESKAWVADPKNRICDAPGSWYCRGQYPPALQKVLAEKKDFSQLEDFNKKENGDEEYQRQYFENLKKKKQGKPIQDNNKDSSGDNKKKPWKPEREVSAAEIAELTSNWADDSETSVLYDMIRTNDLKQFLSLLSYSPELAYKRSSDGRGPMWWAHEFDRPKMIRALKIIGVKDKLQDGNGVTPLDIRDEL